MKEKEKNPNWGGSRKGAGRKKSLPQMLIKGERKNRSFYCSEGEALYLRDMLQLFRKQREYTNFEQTTIFSDVIDTMIKIQLDLPLNNQVNEEKKGNVITNQEEKEIIKQEEDLTANQEEKEDISQIDLSSSNQELEKEAPKKPAQLDPEPHDDEDDNEEYKVIPGW